MKFIILKAYQINNELNDTLHNMRRIQHSIDGIQLETALAKDSTGKGGQYFELFPIIMIGLFDRQCVAEYSI